MDTALKLRIAFDNGDEMSGEQIRNLLEDSDLVRRLTASFEPKPLYAIWRITALSEIPYASTLNYTNQVIEYIQDRLSTPAGFSLSGKETDLLPCYNAMLIEALSKLGRAETPAVQNAVDWIRKYQHFERNTTVLWKGAGVKKYGGCLKATPCFIGVAKSVKALACYNLAIEGKDPELNDLAAKGMEYILSHRLFKRRTTGEPINNHILDIAFPASYLLNVVELLDLARLTGTLDDERCSDALGFIRDRQTSGVWKISYAYKADGYVSFDRRGKTGDWVTYILNRCIDSSLTKGSSDHP